MKISTRLFKSVAVFTFALMFSGGVFGSEPFIGEIRWVGFNFAPRDWADCDGQLLSISQNAALFSLLGTTYGGDGRTTFGLPDLRGRVMVHTGQGPGLTSRSQGQKFGTETETPVAGIQHTVNHPVTFGGLVTHIHNEPPSKKGSKLFVEEAIFGDVAFRDPTHTQPDPTLTGISDMKIVQPSTVVRCIIALQGIFPSRN